MDNKLKLLFISPNLGLGGAQKVIITLLQHLERERFEIHLALVKKAGVYLTDVPQDITIHDLKANHVRYTFIPLFKLIWQLRPQVVLATIFHLNIALLILEPFLPAKTVIIIRETSIPSERMKKEKFKVIWHFLYKIFYPKAHKIICQSNYMLQDVANYAELSQNKLIQIYNPVDEDRIQELVKENPFEKNGPGPHFVCAGRLVYEKNFSLVISNLPKWLTKCPSLQLWILGEGVLEKELKRQVSLLGLDNAVHFVGFQQNPYSWFKYANLYILCSKVEGLPNTILEAIACGCPVLALEHPGGTKEIMELCGLRNHYLKKLPDDIDEVLLKYSTKSSLAEAFKLKNIVRQYTDLFENAAKENYSTWGGLS